MFDRKSIVFYHPGKLVFGEGCSGQFIHDFALAGIKKIFVLTIAPLFGQVKEMLAGLDDAGINYEINCDIVNEPTFADFKRLQKQAGSFGAGAFAGIGGGSVLDTAKLLAALANSNQKLTDIVGINLLKQRGVYLACLPTTSGTGSEVSPNAIFLDETDGNKKGIISPFLVPDASYIDPLLTIGLPPQVTASTAIDAFTHCLEAFVNNFSNPITDMYALEGIRLIFEKIQTAINEPENIEARTALSLGSMYGGMCLGPVNTTAIHALSYPLGSKFKIAHGLSNALLMPYVAEYNLNSALERYAEIAAAMGVIPSENKSAMAQEGILLMKNMVKDAGLPLKMSELGISVNDIPRMAEDALKVQRLLKNNVRTIEYNDAIKIYTKAL
ncbi:MAG: iron-containing alcohol dehydrogenase [Prolixibacteraceae bacterium]|nr:iron-containing alcohol dehydrogenase [Prolixibacteraceae bacterium]